MKTNVFLALILALAAAILPELAMAGAGGTGLSKIVGGGLCDVARDFTGTTGAAIATIGVLILGIGAFFGKVNWGLCILVTVGICVLFGATVIVLTIGGASTCPGTYP